MTRPETTPPSSQTGSAPARPQVRLDIRIGTTEPTQHTITGGEYLIGGAAGCNLILPGAHLPHLICQIAVTTDGVRLRRLADTFPVLLNGEPAPAITPMPLHTGDRLSVGPADITVAVRERAVLRPSLIPFPAPGPSEPAAQSPTPPPPRVAEELLRQEWAKLDQAKTRFAEEAAELEADRVLWYRRRAEIEAECQRLRDHATAPVAALTEREQLVQIREQELKRTQNELAAIREQLFTQYTGHRAELAQIQETLHARQTEFAQREQRFEAELRTHEPRLAELRLRQEQLSTAFGELNAQRSALEIAKRELAQERESFTQERQQFEQERAEHERARTAQDEERTLREEQFLAERKKLAEDRERYTADLLRLDRWQGTLDDRKQYLDHYAAEVDLRSAQVRRDTAELEEQVTLADAEQGHLRAENERLEQLRGELDARSGQLSEQASRIESQQATLAVLQAKLERQQHDLRQEAARLAAERVRQEEARTELDTRLRDAEVVRAELSLVRDDRAEQERAFAERTSLLETTLQEIHDQQDQLAGEQARLKQREEELDQRSAEIAEQAAMLKSRLTQALDLQQRLETDRAALRQREGTLTETETARVAFQDQLRRRAEELANRSRELDQAAARVAEERTAWERVANDFQQERARTEQIIQTTRDELAARTAELERQTAHLTEREATLMRQVDRLRETGRNVAQGRKQLAEARRQWDADRTAAAERDQQSREDLLAFHNATGTQIERLRTEAQSLEEQTGTAFERLTAARELLRGQLAELHTYAAQSRSELDAARAALRADADRIRDREQLLERARDENRLAVAQFRQQLLEWQTRVGDLKETMARTESRVDTRQAEVNAAASRLDATTLELARQTEELRREREQVSERRAEVDRHLSDMREWYRKKLRELANQNTPTLPVEMPEPTIRIAPTAPDDLEPGDRQLGDLLRSLDLIDGEALTALWNEANRQHRTLRQVLLASGAISLYQLALIEAGNLDALMLGRFRVVDRLRVTPRETVYRVFDPLRADGPSHGTFLLRHLSESECQDATHPDEFRQRFAAVREAAHPNLAATVEVLDILGRPAAVQEWITGAPSLEWPATAAIPGVWLRLVSGAAAGLAAGHAAGLVHGRLVSNTFVLTDDGDLKLLGLADPYWLLGLAEPDVEPTAAVDLRALGRIIFGWSQLGQQAASKKRGSRTKGFPEQLLTIIRRLEADADTPMADTAVGAEPYHAIEELLDHIQQLAVSFPCRSTDWAELLAEVAGRSDESEPFRQSA
ncbi:MAG: hypothetical protein LC104_01425 [Bacteroidales bacterium]|nr:hypothetical protein [Bacteroidales bacterium]